MAKTTLTREQLDTLRTRLEEQRRKLVGVLDAARARPGAADERSSEFEEQAQRATEGTQRSDIAQRERALLVEVDRALAKLAAGTYGISEASGEPIRYERLAAIPWARNDADE